MLTAPSLSHSMSSPTPTSSNGSTTIVALLGPELRVDFQMPAPATRSSTAAASSARPRQPESRDLEAVAGARRPERLAATVGTCEDASVAADAAAYGSFPAAAARSAAA